MIGIVFIIFASVSLFIILASDFAVASDNEKVSRIAYLIWWRANVLVIACIVLLISGLILTFIVETNAQVKELQEGKILSISNEAIIYSINDEIKDFTKFTTEYAEIDKPKIRFNNNSIPKKVIVELPIDGITDFDVEGE